MPTMTLNEKASEAYGWFETAARDNGNSFVRLKDGAPEWVTELVHRAHGDFLPDDWRYSTIRNAVGWIADESDPDEPGEFADSEVDVYTGARLAWFGSNLNRAGYVDEALEEFGAREVSDSSELIELIGLGQYFEASEVFRLVVEALRDALEDADDDDDTDD